ncbi:acetyltransferase family protein [[Clostridium] bifermentans ATCC 638]|uniref:Acetyltransferase family protein n=1 Tax=Paraclostridium bifermentans ATCC 638 = DSM 14991 TaxID=1233171 RepID=T4VMJ4_PARBF|nr:GNAT family N-acetyltransferase [Paraclostridium bifermentans]EQK41991.1 acetyltransferase family protein [[Clostridium] bifermentans ATCC 638] [Paraclostridium bifermentans ATCC 638 = DSM 14991]UAG18863.1 GNAT family N-acetyltransferase [Paraclostridium bifermentans]
MILKLDECYHDQIIEYLIREEDFNLFVIGDIERYGYDNQFFNIWGDFNTVGDINGLLIQYFDLLTLYSYDNRDLTCFIEHINSLPFSNINGKIETLKYIEPYINYNRKRIVNFCVLKNISYLKEHKLDSDVKKIRFGKIGKILSLYEDINEFQKPTIQSIRENLRTGRGYYIEKDKKIVSMAKSTSESTTHAMIVGVGTHPMYRNKGYATKCIVKLCNNLINEKKKPCLFYDNEDAGKIYKKLGFKEVGQWVIYYM